MIKRIILLMLLVSLTMGISAQEGLGINQLFGNRIVTNITSVIGKEEGITLRSLNIDSAADGIFQGNFTVMVSGTAALTLLTKKINAVKGVKTVERLNS